MQLAEKLDWKGLRTKRISHTAQYTLSTSVIKPNLLMTYEAKLLFVLRPIRNL
jgi:hypothetical protein